MIRDIGLRLLIGLVVAALIQVAVPDEFKIVCATVLTLLVFFALMMKLFSKFLMELKVIDKEFSVCKVSDFSEIDTGQPYIFTGSTDEERSLVCPTELVPGNTI